MPVTSHFGPRNARAASSVSSVSPSCETHTSRSASGGASTASSACTAQPPVCAAWNDVPHPVKTTRAPSGSRSPVGTCAQPLRLREHRTSRFARHSRFYSIAAMSVFERQTLDNGLRVLTAPLPHAQSVACFVMLAAGSRYEEQSNRGIAHFAEHMFFKGTERRPSSRDLTTLVDGIGGEFNAFTSKEYTGYYVRCAGADRDTALDVLIDMIRNSKFDPEEIEREKGVILEEMNMYFDTPRDYIGSVYEALMFGDNPLGWETLGTKDTIKGANRDTFTDYVNRWYTPDRMVIGVSGMVGDDLVPTLEQHARRDAGERPRDARAAPCCTTPATARTSACTTRTPTRRRSSSACRACRSSIPTATRCRCSRPCSARACRRASSSRCASAAASPTPSTARTTPTPTPARSTRRRASTSRGSTTRSR